MSRAVIKTHGFRELERALIEELPKATARNVLDRTATNSMKLIEDRMAQLAPFDPQDKDKDGRHLNQSMKTQKVKASRQQGSVKFKRSEGVAVLTGPAPSGKLARSNAGWQEFGTVKMAPNSYARPAADAEAENVIGLVREELTAQIEKAKARIAKKAAKGGKR